MNCILDVIEHQPPLPTTLDFISLFLLGSKFLYSHANFDRMAVIADVWRRMSYFCVSIRRHDSFHFKRLKWKFLNI